MSGRNHRDIFAKDVEWGSARDGMISYATFVMDPDDSHAPHVLISKFAPGTRIPPHTHGSNYFEYVMAGGQMVGKQHYGVGDVRLVKAGTGYGPIVVDAEGLTALIVFQDGSGSMTQWLPDKGALAG